MSLKGADEIDCSTCIRPWPGRASAPCCATRSSGSPARAARRGLTADVSDTARGFFEHRGFVAQRRNTVALGDEWLANTTMEKKLTPKGSTP